MESTPLVTVIVPTTHDRTEFNEAISRTFDSQDYLNKYLHFDSGPESIGRKLNNMCSGAMGDIIIRMDSDDKYADNWISKQVEALITSGADITGLSSLYFYDIETGGAWKYTYGRPTPPWVAGATMCFWKKFWERNHFMDKSIGEDNSFVWNAPQGTKVFCHDYIEGFMAIMHGSNVSGKRALQNVRFAQCSEEKEKELMTRWDMPTPTK